MSRSGATYENYRQPSGTYRLRAVKMSTVTKPYVVFHRGLPDEYAENTMRGLRMAASAGAQVMNIQARMTLDKVWKVTHDTTLDRTTNLTGLPIIESLLSGKVEQATISPSKIAAVAGFGFADGVDRVPDLAEAFDEFSGDYDIVLEMKSTGADAIASMLALLARFDIKDSLVVCSFDYANLQALAAAGYAAQWLDADAAPPAGRTLADMVVAGVTLMGWDYSLVSDGTVAAVLAAGIKGMPYVVNYRKDRDHLYGLGVDGVVSDEGSYLLSSGGYVDAFESQVPFPGMNGSASSAYRGEFFGTNRFGVGAGSATVQEIVAAPPIPVADLTTYTTTVVMTFDTAPVAGWGGYFFGAADDRATNMGSAPSAGMNFLKVNVSNTLAAGGVAQVRMYAVDTANTLTQIGSSVAGAAVIADGGSVTAVIGVSPAGFSVPVSGSATGTISSGGAASKLYRGRPTFVGRGGSALTKASIGNRVYA